MHPRTREVRRPDSGIDPRGSGSQPPLLQGFLKHRKPGAAAKAGVSEAAASDAPVPEATPAAKAPKARAKAVSKPAATSAPKARKRAAPST